MAIHRTRTIPEMSFGRVVGSYLRLLRLQNLVVALLAFACGGLLGGWHQAVTLPTGLLVEELGFLLLAIGCLGAASNAINQICDYSIDLQTKPWRPLPSGEMGLTGATLTTGLLLVIGLGLAFYVTQEHLETLAWIAAALVCWLAYSLPPLRLRRFGLMANLLNAVPLCFLVVAGWSAARGDELRLAWFVGGIAAGFMFGASTLKDFADMDADENTGIRSLPSIYGPDRATQLAAPWLVLSFVPLALLALVPDLFAFSHGVFDPLLLTLFTAVLASWGFTIVLMIWKNAKEFEPGKSHPSQHQAALLLAFYFVGLLAIRSLS